MKKKGKSQIKTLKFINDWQHKESYIIRLIYTIKIIGDGN